MKIYGISNWGKIMVVNFKVGKDNGLNFTAGKEPFLNFSVGMKMFIILMWNKNVLRMKNSENKMLYLFSKFV